MQDSLMSQGVDLMVTGMGTVLIFLAVLVVLTTIMSRVMSRYFPEPVIEAPVRAKVATSSQPVDPTTLKVLQQAISKHREKTLK